MSGFAGMTNLTAPLGDIPRKRLHRLATLSTTRHRRTPNPLLIPRLNSQSSASSPSPFRRRSSERRLTRRRVPGAARQPCAAPPVGASVRWNPQPRSCASTAAEHREFHRQPRLPVEKPRIGRAAPHGIGGPRPVPPWVSPVGDLPGSRIPIDRPSAWAAGSSPWSRKTCPEADGEARCRRRPVAPRAREATRGASWLETPSSAALARRPPQRIAARSVPLQRLRRGIEAERCSAVGALRVQLISRRLSPPTSATVKVRRNIPRPLHPQKGDVVSDWFGDCAEVELPFAGRGFPAPAGCRATRGRASRS